MSIFDCRNTRAVGVICEYNPFHNGHAYHLRKVRNACPEARIVCVMSGPFTQRGEAAVLDAVARARMALTNGADIVFELPVLFSVRDARTFARGGVTLLDKLGVCGALSFGCEDVRTLGLALESDDGDPAVARRLKEGLARGESFARARGLPNLPNVVLGAEYIRAIRETGCGMISLPIERAPEPLAVDAGMVPARRIRETISETGAYAAFVPDDVYEYISCNPARLRETGRLDALLLGTLRSIGSDAIGQAAEATEGIERRIAACAERAVSRTHLIELVKCKRYTYTHISRILTQAMLGITKELALAHPEPEYARLLGFRKDASPLLREIQDGAAISIVMRPALFRKENNPVFALDLRAAAIAALACAGETARRGDEALTDGVVIV